jgi:uncharacterized protein (TIRG00374 family)
MKFLRMIGILVGAALILLLIHAVGWTPIRQTLEMLGWKYVLVIVYPLTWILMNTFGWLYACHPDAVNISFKELTEIRLAGETFNSLLPSSYMGGEPLKAKLFSRWVTFREATSSVLIAKSAQSIGLLFFLGLGLTLGLPPSASATLKAKSWLAFGVLTVGVLLFTVFLANQSFSRLGRFLHSITRLPWLQAQEDRLVALDESLGVFYRECKGRFLASILWHGAGWIAGAAELWMIFYFMGHPLTWYQAWFMGAMAQLGMAIGLISPGGLGFYEGGHYMAAVLLGLPPSLGISASLIRRVRELFWDGVGLYFFWRYTKAEPEKSS